MAEATDDRTVDAAEPRLKRRRLPLIIVGVLALCLAIWGTDRYLYSRHHVSTDNAQVDGHITLISPRVAAFVSRILVDDNQHVAAGDTLVVLDNRDLKVRLQQAEAELRGAEAAVGSRGRTGQAQAEFQATRAEAGSAVAGVSAAEADYRKAAANVERYRKLASQKIVSAQQLDAAEAAFSAAAAKLESA